MVAANLVTPKYSGVKNKLFTIRGGKRISALAETIGPWEAHDHELGQFNNRY